MKQVYMDFAASTPVDPAVLNKMMPFFKEIFGNPSSSHSQGRAALEAIEQARKQVGSCFHVKDETIVFTSGGTEADNLALKGIAFQHHPKKSDTGPHIITSCIEHPAVLQTCKQLETYGYRIHYLPVDQFGLIDLETLEESITKDTFLISIMYANNEIGTIEPVKEIGTIAHDHDVLFHTDAVQVIGKIPIDLSKLPIDLLSLSSHKIYGPKGVGALYHSNKIKIDPLLQGGGHEKGLRSGTLNTPGIVGLGQACELCLKRIDTDVKHMTKLRDQLIKTMLDIEESYLNGHPKKRLANNAHFRFTAIEGESLLMMLDDAGIAAATGSACSSKKLQASHVLTSIGLSPELAHGSLRLTLGRKSTKEEVNFVCETIPGIVKKLRTMSPLWDT